MKNCLEKIVVWYKYISESHLALFLFTWLFFQICLVTLYLSLENQVSIFHWWFWGKPLSYLIVGSKYWKVLVGWGYNFWVMWPQCLISQKPNKLFRTFPVWYTGLGVTRERMKEWRRDVWVVLYYSKRGKSNGRCVKQIENMMEVGNYRHFSLFGSF